MKLRELKKNHQRGDMARALTRVKRFDLALDCGAHRGIVAGYLAGRFTKVVAIEPSVYADTISIPNVSVIKAAVGAVSGRCGMAHGRRNTGQRHVTEGSAYEVITIDSLGLSPDFIKLDVEGYEFYALQGAEQTIRTHKPVIIFEENSCHIRYGIEDGAPGRLLKSWGMELLDTWKSIKGEKDREYVYGWRLP